MEQARHSLTTVALAYGYYLGHTALTVYAAAYIHTEERYHYLERVFGDLYRRYRARTPRYLGLPYRNATSRQP